MCVGTSISESFLWRQADLLKPFLLQTGILQGLSQLLNIQPVSSCQQKYLFNSQSGWTFTICRFPFISLLSVSLSYPPSHSLSIFAKTYPLFMHCILCIKKERDMSYNPYNQYLMLICLWYFCIGKAFCNRRISNSNPLHTPPLVCNVYNKDSNQTYMCIYYENL